MVLSPILAWCTSLWESVKSVIRKIQDWGLVLILKWGIGISLIFILGYLIYSLIEICRCYESVLECLKASKTNAGGLSALRNIGSVAVVLGSFLGLLWSITRTKVIDEGNRDDRFAHATKMFGSQQASVRLGAARILFDIALMPEMKHLRSTIAHMMSAHIQEVTDKDDYKKKHEKTPSHEIQTMLDLLFVPRRGQEEKQTKFWDGIPLSLNGSYLWGADLRGANLKEADLRYVQLQKSILKGANFKEADLRYVQLQESSLEGANFKEANLGWAQLQGSDIAGTTFYGAQLDRAKLHWVYADDAIFNGATLINTEFWGASLRGSQFRGAFLQYAQFQLSNLRKADFRGSILDQTQIYALSDTNGNPRCKFSGSQPREDIYWFSKVMKLEDFEERIRAHEDKKAVLDEEGKPEGVLLRSFEFEEESTTDTIIGAWEKCIGGIPEASFKRITEKWESILNDPRKDMDRWGGRKWFKLKKYGHDKGSQWITAYKAGKKPKLRDWSKKTKEYRERLRKDREATKPKE